ncbi:MAG: NAD(P)-dependent alcohol dehydrogenase [Ardenticatenaceae bacterium]|nr:NAD(P)-dependent alcohol dehydrogenase [Ardenticatenaceae bacterium]
MKAIVNETYGSPDVLELREVEKPTPEANEVLVKLHVVSANPLDWHLMRGEPIVARFSGGMFKPKINILGADIAGQVEAVGRDVTRFKPGDVVFGGSGSGGFAEYVCVQEKYLVPKPENITDEAAAAVPVAALTALQSLRDKGQIQAGEKVLVNGASGGVGTFTVQIAKALGAEVTGVCSTRNVELVRSIGADHVIDYTREDFRRSGKRYDLIIDNVGNCSVADYRRTLTPKGRCIVVGFTTMPRMLQVVVLGSLRSRFSEQRIELMLASINQEDLAFMNELLESGKVIPVIDRCYPLDETAAAIEYLESGRARGKVIIKLND